MKITTLIARLLLALAFLVAGLNGFFQFIPQGPMPAGPAGQFLNVLMASHYILFVAGIQVIAGFLFLVNRYVPLALVLIGPVIVNILLFHALLFHTGFEPGLLMAICWIVAACSVRTAFAGIFRKST